MLFAFAASHAQLKGVPFDEAISFEEVEEYTVEELYGVLIKIEVEGITAYPYIYEVKSKGYYDALKRLSWILEANNISRSADIEDSYFRSHIDESDYNEVVYELSIEKGWIERTWYVYDDNWKIYMNGNDESIVVGVAQNKQEPFERERQAQPERLNNLGKNAFGNQGAGEIDGSQGVMEGSGSQGDINGSPDADSYGTGGGMGNGPSYGGLGSRTARGSLPLPNMSGCEIMQKIEIKVEIQVDQDGKVISAIVQSASFQDNCIWTMVVQAAEQSRFSVDQNANYRQTGWIKYIIVP